MATIIITSASVLLDLSKCLSYIYSTKMYMYEFYFETWSGLVQADSMVLKQRTSDWKVVGLKPIVSKNFHFVIFPCLEFLAPQQALYE